jgi:hypothetical protein
MKVLRQGTDALVIEEWSWSLRVLGGVFAGIGLLVLVIPRHPGFAGYLAGGLSLLFGAGFIILPRVSTITFDRGRGTIQLDRVGLLLPEVHRTAALAAISEVEVDGGRDSDGDRTFRVTVEITGEDPIPFTTYFSSGRAAKVEMVYKVRDWLAAGTPPANPVRS